MNDLSTAQPIPLSKREAEIQRFLSEDEIMQVVLRFETKDATRPIPHDGTDKPFTEPQDLTSYGIRYETQKKLWKLEVRRLIESAQNINEPLRFHGNGLFEGITDAGGFQCLHLIAREIHEAFYICTHDFDLFMLEHVPELTEDVIKSFLKSHRILALRERILQQSQSSSVPDWYQRFNGRQREAYFLLVDYMTATLARYLTRCAVGRSWTQECIALLAKWAAKLKVISGNPKQAVMTTMTKANALRTRKRMEQEEELVEWVYGVTTGVAAESKKQSELVGALDNAMRSEKADGGFKGKAKRALVFHSYLSTTFYYLLYDLQTSQGHEDCFQVARVVYKSGLDDWMTLLTSDRESLIAASSSFPCLRYAHVALDIFVATAISVKVHQKPSDLVNSTEISEHEVEVFWKYSVENAPSAQSNTSTSVPLSITSPDWVANRLNQKQAGDQMKISKMNEAISVLVPLSLMDTTSISNVASLLYIVNLVDDYSPPDQFENTMYTATAHMTTQQYNKRFPRGFDKDINRVPTGPLWDAAFIQSPHRKGFRATIPLPLFHNDKLHNPPDNLHHIYERMDSWTYDQASISVPCRLYVVTVVSVAVTLVGCGLATGFTVGTRISGVDPFNMTLFFWILAGFILAGFKSLRVEDWPWRDFMFGRVVCRSVSELHAVTRVDEQLILRRLLQKEKVNILRTKGPFNEAFLRQAPDGFSIDRPLTLRSMMLSGLVMIKVKTPEGFALVCLDVKKDTLSDSISVRETSEDNERLVCMDLSPTAKGSFGEFKLSRRKLGWIKTVGLYSVMDSKFG